MVFSHGVFQEAQAQASVITNVRDAIRAGSSRELTKHFNDMVELNLEGKTSNYSKEQATFVLKKFFEEHPTSNFTYIHQGVSKDGIQYAIGSYAHASGSFRVYMLVKQVGGQYKVTQLNIDKE